MIFDLLHLVAVWPATLVNHGPWWTAAGHTCRVLFKHIQQTFWKQQQNYFFLLKEQVNNHILKRKPKGNAKDPSQTTPDTVQENPSRAQHQSGRHRKSSHRGCTQENPSLPVQCAINYSCINIQIPYKIKYPCKLDKKQQAIKSLLWDVPGWVTSILDPKRPFKMI